MNFLHKLSILLKVVLNEKDEWGEAMSEKGSLEREKDEECSAAMSEMIQMFSPSNTRL